MRACQKHFVESDTHLLLIQLIKTEFLPLVKIKSKQRLIM